MEELFLTVVNLSLTAGWLVLAVLVLRLFLRKAPKWSICLLWALVALRLVFPISIESALSLIPSAQPLPQEILYTAAPEIQSGIPALNSAVNPVLQNMLAPSPTASANPTQFWSFLLSRVWLAGMVGLLLYGLISTLLLKRQLATATLLEGNVKQSERVASPFVLGLFRPVIYLPYHIPEGDLDYVLAHERTHIRRLDHWWKLLGFVLLAVYWFHPLMWVAYVLFCRDLEGACDEKIIRTLNLEERRGYSTALLNCSIRRRSVAPCPLAFGEAGVKSRVKAVMSYKKPAFWMVIIALAACIIAALCFLTNPKSHQPSLAGLYRYEGDGFGGDFTITLQADGSFTYYEGGLSSYIGDGKWSVSGDILTLEDESGAAIVNRFRMEGDELIFQAKDSTNFIYVKVADGSVFSKNNEVNNPFPSTLSAEVHGTTISYGSKTYNLSQRNNSINAITNQYQIGNYLIFEGHTGPKNGVYFIFNIVTQTFEPDLQGANLTWYGNDIRSVVYSFRSDVYAYDGTLLASFPLNEGDYINGLLYLNDPTQIEVQIMTASGDSYTELIQLTNAQ